MEVQVWIGREGRHHEAEKEHAACIYPQQTTQFCQNRAIGIGNLCIMHIWDTR
jgi:hypothetical protein